METRTKIIIYGGGAVVLIALIFALTSNKSSPETSILSSGIDPEFARLQVEQARINSDNSIALSLANIEASREVSIAQLKANTDLADITSNFEVSQKAIDAQSATDFLALNVEREINLSQISSNTAIAFDDNATSLDYATTVANTNVDLARINASVEQQAVQAQAARDVAIINSLGQVRKKSRDNVLKTLITGVNDSPQAGPSKTAQVIDSAGGVIKSIGKIFG